VVSFVIVRSLLRGWPSYLAAFVVACSVYEAPSETSDSLGGAGSGGSSEAGKANGGSNADAGSVAAGTTSGGSDPGSAGSGGSVAGGSPSTAGSGGSDVVEPSAGAPDGGSPSQADECPDDPNKLAPGSCGCGIPDVSTATMSDCHVLKAKLAHRYDFEGTGTVVKDRIGSAHGSIARSATLSKLDGRGVVLLGGGTAGPYVDLPNGLLSTLSNATLEAWVTWGGGANWQRIFDFGDSTNPTPENNPANGKSYLFLTPKSSLGGVLTGFSTNGNSMGQETQAKGADPLSLSIAHVAVVADDKGDKLRLYVNGSLVALQTWTGQLAQLNDVNVWLGRSQYDGDPELSAVFHEFRVYGAALTDADIATSYAGGPDPDFLAY
jgi:hypothetical protein